jgi:hypothetical protein
MRLRDVAWLPAALAIAMLLMAFGLRGSQTLTHFLDALALETGIAVLIGSVAASTIERHYRRRAETEHREQRREIEADIFRHLFGMSVSRELLDELTYTVFAAKFVREKLSLRYEFDIFDAGDPDQPVEFVKVRHTVSYQLRNTGRDPEKFRIRHYFENVAPSSQHRDRFTAFHVEGLSETIAPNETALKEMVTQEGIRQCLHTRIEVPPTAPAIVSYTYEAVRRISDSETWISTLPANGIRITAVVLNKSLSGLCFYPDSAHRLDPKRLSGDTSEECCFHEWEIASAVLPYQGVMLYWHPRDVAGAPRAATAQ